MALGCALWLLAPGPGARAAQIRADQQPAPGRMRVRVDLVGVVASVLDPDGKPVPNLPREAFEVYEDGRRQRIDVFQRQTNLPLDLALMIDTSLSTLTEMKFEREAASHFIHEVLRPGDRLSVFQFALNVTQLSSFSGDSSVLDDGLRRLHSGTGTSLFDAILLGSRAIGERPADHRRVILLVTDAGETTSHGTYEAARDAAVRAGAMLYTILIRPVKSESGRNTAGEHAVDTIIDMTGGGLYTVDSPDQFTPTFDRINQELRTEYMLGYYPDPPPPAGAYRQIDVRLNPPGPAAGARYFVRYRKGYYAPESNP
ncbi:MAG TPA: VWA domain-containing protein [Candidatus Acidoferrales bacterium]|nr:VWA domain-containing protein [Candidatus Acidoferrales bacterium]